MKGQHISGRWVDARFTTDPHGFLFNGVVPHAVAPFEGTRERGVMDLVAPRVIVDDPPILIAAVGLAILLKAIT